MTDQPDDGRNTWWDPFGVWQQVGDPFADLAADQRLPAWGSRNGLQALLNGLRAALVGRPIVVGSGASRVAFTLSSLEASRWATWRLRPVRLMTSRWARRTSTGAVVPVRLGHCAAQQRPYSISGQARARFSADRCVLGDEGRQTERLARENHRSCGSRYHRLWADVRTGRPPPALGVCGGSANR